MSYSNQRNPAAMAFLGGEPLPALIEAEISSNAYFGAARFRLQLATDCYTASALVLPGLLLDIQIGLGGPLTSLIQGEVDSLTMDVINGTVTLEGRDLTGRLLDARTEETFSNQTASEIAETLAARHGLTPDVTPTTALAGRYYSNEHNRITLGQFARSTTEWDLLTFLAAREGFEVFVSGTTLSFGPLPSEEIPFILTPQQCVSLNLDHALTLAKDVEVTVKSWNTRQQAAFTQTARSSASSQTGGQPRKIVVVRPNLAPNDALQLAQRILADLSGHERVVSAELPGELSLSPRSQIALSGTGTDFDQLYHVSELNRRFTLEQGFVETLRLKNTSTQGQTALAESASNS